MWKSPRNAHSVLPGERLRQLFGRRPGTTQRLEHGLVSHTVEEHAPEKVGIMGLEVPDLSYDVQGKGVHGELNTIEWELGTRTGHDTRIKKREKVRPSTGHTEPPCIDWTLEWEAQYTLFRESRQQCCNSL